MTQVGFIFFAHTFKATYNNICLLFAPVFLILRGVSWCRSTYAGLFLYVISTGVLSSVPSCFLCWLFLIFFNSALLHIRVHRCDSSIRHFDFSNSFSRSSSSISSLEHCLWKYFVCRENWIEGKDKGGDGLWLIKLMFCMIRADIYIFYDATQILLNQDMCQHVQDHLFLHFRSFEILL